jgi:hypothetical protein
VAAVLVVGLLRQAVAATSMHQHDGLMRSRSSTSCSASSRWSCRGLGRGGRSRLRSTQASILPTGPLGRSEAASGPRAWLSGQGWRLPRFALEAFGRGGSGSVWSLNSPAWNTGAVVG